MSNSFLVFADIELDGFVVAVCDSRGEANIIMKKIFALGELPSPFSLEDITEMLYYFRFTHYKLTEENKFAVNCLDYCSNGFFSVGIAELNNQFTEHDYIQSRIKKW